MKSLVVVIFRWRAEIACTKRKGMRVASMIELFVSPVTRLSGRDRIAKPPINHLGLRVV